MSSDSAAKQRVLLMAGSMETGGSERQTLLLLRHLDRERFVPHLFLSRRCGDLLHQVPQDVIVHAFWDHHETPWPNWPGRIHASQVRWLRQVIRSNRIDVVYDRTFHMTLIAGPATRCMPGVRRIATIVSPPNRDVQGTEKRFLWIKKRRLAAAYAAADHVIAVSDVVADSTRAFYGLQPPSLPQLQVLPNPVDVETVTRSAADSSRQWFHADDHSLKIICVGRMTHEKGHDVLLRSVASLDRPAQLLLVGDGPRRQSIERSAMDLGIESKTHFVGVVPNACPAIAAADVLVLPSRYEGMPNAVLEAMVLGVPVIATTAGGTATLLRDGECGIAVSPDDVNQMASAISNFELTAPETIQRIEKARQMMLRQYDIRHRLSAVQSLLSGD
ncbi:MAG: glycosyltransferase, partial [Planctomycetota bacterium]